MGHQVRTEKMIWACLEAALALAEEEVRLQEGAIRREEATAQEVRPHKAMAGGDIPVVEEGVTLPQE